MVTSAKVRSKISMMTYTSFLHGFIILAILSCNNIHNKANANSLQTPVISSTIIASSSDSSSSSSGTSDSTILTMNGCVDIQEYTFKTPENQNATCSWISESPHIRCNLLDEHQIQVNTRCRATCNSCIIPTKKLLQPRQIQTNKNTASNSTHLLQPSRHERNLQRLQKQKVGSYCIQDSDCYSWLCRENTCFQSDECKSIKHIPGQEYHENSINLVFVGSGFTSLESWQYHVAKTLRAFNAFDFFEFHNPRYNAFYVEDLQSEGFCRFNCDGFATLLCCDVKKSRELSNKCFPTGSLLQTIVIENSDQYGGAGYRYQNLATTSIHPLGPLVAVHELGHSLFELGDEYDSTFFTADSAANCDVEGCPKWKDLSDHFEGDYCVLKGCKNGNYYVAENSFMRELDQPMGHVNLRYTCCTYLAITKGMPEYCKKYDFGDGLIEYCQNDYQGYGGPDVYKEDGRTVENDSSKGKFVVVTNPVRIHLDLTDGTYEYADSETFDEGPQLVLRREFYGDFHLIIHVCNSPLSQVLEVTVEFDTGEVKKLYFNDKDDVDIPPESETSVKVDNDAFIESVVLEIVVEASHGVVTDVQMETLEITLWFRIRTWIMNFFKEMFGLSF